jgi:chromosome segregation ATPase
MGRVFSNTPSALAAAVAVSLAIGAAHGQSARSGGGASAQLMQQMQQLASERTSLQAENSKLKKDLEDMRKERDALKSSHQALDRRAKTSEGSLKELLARRDSSEQELTQDKEKMQQLVAKFREVAQTLRETETQQTAAKQTLAAREQDLKVCVDHNQALYKLNDEVLTRLENQGVWSRVASAEPFTRIKRTQLDNYVVESKARADAQRLPSAAAPAPSSASSAVPH